jgi:hypothetical protein
VLLFLFVVVVIYFSEKKKRETEFLLAAVLYSTVQLVFKTKFLVELDIDLLFS